MESTRPTVASCTPTAAVRRDDAEVPVGKVTLRWPGCPNSHSSVAGLRRTSSRSAAKTTEDGAARRAGARVGDDDVVRGGGRRPAAGSAHKNPEVERGGGQLVPLAHDLREPVPRRDR